MNKQDVMYMLRRCINDVKMTKKMTCIRMKNTMHFANKR